MQLHFVGDLILGLMSAWRLGIVVLFHAESPNVRRVRCTAGGFSRLFGD